MNRPCIPVSILLLFTLCSCARGDEGSPAHSFRIHEENGVTIAETSGGPRYSGEIFTYEKVLEIRGYPSEERSYLVSPYPPSMDTDGYFYVPDTGSHRIVVFSSDGRFVREFGRAGEGPGDLQDPTHVQVMGDRVVVTSSWVPAGYAHRQRMTTFTKTGELFDLYLEDLQHALGYHMYFKAPSGERIATWWEDWNQDGFKYVRASCIVESPGGDTLACLASPIVVSGEQITDQFQGRVRTYMEDYLYAARPHIVFLPPDRIAVSDGNRPLLLIHDLRGYPVRDIRLGISREPVTREDRDRLIALYDDKIERLRPYAVRTGDTFEYDFTRNDKENLLFPEDKACWDWLRSDDAGHLWLQVREERPFNARANTVDRYRVVSPEGEYLGITDWPPVTDALIQHGFLLAIVTDPETDERVPTVFRIVPAVEGLRYPN